MHALELTNSLFQSGKILLLEPLEVQAVLTEAALDDLANGLRQRVAMLVRHLVDQVDDLAQLAVGRLSLIVDLVLGLLDVC